MADDELAHFYFPMLLVLKNCRQRVIKNALRFLERDIVLLDIAGSFGGVPCVVHGDIIAAKQEIEKSLREI